MFGPHGPIDNTLRFPDECVRHKLLDVVGDLALTGCEVIGHVVAYRCGISSMPSWPSGCWNRCTSRRPTF